MESKLLIFSSFLFSIISFSQELNPENYIHNGIVNDSKLVMDVLENQYPEYKNRVNETFEQAKIAGLSKTGQRLSIKTVVHVVWKESEENLPDSVIYRQIEILNKDYTRTNPDTSNLRTIFEPVAGNPNIDFNVIHINRVQTNATFELSFVTGLPDNVKQTANGGSDAWETDKFLNIWICKIDGGALGALLGYAYPPSGLSNWPAGSNAPSSNLDGVVLDYRTIGDNNPNEYVEGGIAIDLVGRTATHEVGHYLGLRHIWGDGGGLLGGESCNADDGCADTPNQGFQSDFDCNTSNNTCIDNNNDLPDLIENHMDYSAENCKNMFTNDQVSIMRGVLESQRNDIVGDYVDIDEQAKISFNLFPNPASDELTIQLHQNGNHPCSIHNLLGKEVKSGIIEGNQLLDISDLSNGIYLVNLGNKNVEQTKRLVIHR